MKAFSIGKALFLSLAMSLLLAGGVGGADGPAAAISLTDPDAMLQEATKQLLDISRTAQTYADKDRERYYAEISTVLDQVVDIRFFARSVMANYASARLYNSLKTDAEREALRDRLGRFEIALKRVWMVTYADALLGFKSARIELVKIPSPSTGENRLSMQQTVYHADGHTYVIQYSLHKLTNDNWMISNVIVENVNLGLIYRNQFAAAVESHKGDVDDVVDHWVEIMIHEQPSASAAREPAAHA